ncbi:MAG TPA: hypothetical protein ENH87_15535 [Pricia antarctica]|uniref:Serpin domain-containing protein n=1 Tax=Pricia antarctica TaxID=641691 RepID=A0A831QS55_9FLAO|nr:hypothetical protein [Pricia antarctica]
MVYTNNSLALDFFREIPKTETSEEYMLSPLSLTSALGMT